MCASLQRARLDGARLRDAPAVPLLAGGPRGEEGPDDLRRERFPQISEAQCLTAMQLVLPDGRVLAGADAVPELLNRVRGWRHVAWVFGLPPLRPLARRVYAWVARNRMKISCRLPGA